MHLWSTACPDWERRILAGESLVPDLPLFREEANRGLRIFKKLRIPDVIGRPTMADACGPWFFPIVEALFGSYDPSAHRRMIQEFMLVIPKKNGKSSNGGAVMVVALIVNRRPEAEFLFVAPTKEIANIAFKQAKGTIKADEELDKLFHIQDHIRRITHRRNGASLEIKAADTDVITGSKALGTMIDETHVFAKKSRAADLFVELRGALAARPDGFLFQTTTQSKEPPAGVFKSELKMARDVRDGKIDLPLLPIIYELPSEVAKDDGWRDEKYWPLVNPNLNRSVDLDFLRREVLKADDQGAESLALIASQHFDVEIGLSLLSDRWAGADHWVGASDGTLTLETLIQRSDVAVAGVDGGGLDDLLGLAVIGRDRVTRKWLLWTHAWAQDEVFERRKEIIPKLKDFISEGTLTRCESPTQDVEEVADHVEMIRDAGLLPEKNAVGLDPVGVAAMVDELAERKVEGEQVVGITQGYRLSGAVWGMERKLKDGTLRHGGTAMMSWVVGNAKVEQRGNAVLVTKQAAGKAKIDPLIASFNAVMLMARNPIASKREYRVVVL